jgi:hypothetical protein
MTEARMFHPRTSINLTHLRDALLCLGVAAYFLGSFAAIEATLRKLTY